MESRKNFPVCTGGKGKARWALFPLCHVTLLPDAMATVPLFMASNDRMTERKEGTLHQEKFKKSDQSVMCSFYAVDPSRAQVWIVTNEGYPIFILSLQMYRMGLNIPDKYKTEIGLVILNFQKSSSDKRLSCYLWVFNHCTLLCKGWTNVWSDSHKKNSQMLCKAKCTTAGNGWIVLHIH
jgi:hypothetical protein